MEQYSGKVISNGIAIGRIRVYTKEKHVTTSYRISDVTAEITRYEDAKNIAKKQLHILYEKTLAEVGEASAKIFEIHTMLLQDPDYNASVYDIIQSESINVESAVAATCEKFVALFENMKEEYFRARAMDVKDISNRLVDILSDSQSDTDIYNTQKESNEGMQSEEPAVLVAEDLSPADFVQLDKAKVLACVTKEVSYYSHTAILARNMGIPMLTEVDIEKIRNGKMSIIDAKLGKIILEPDDDLLEQYTEKKATDQNTKLLLQDLKGKQDVTRSGQEMKLYANIESLDEVADVLINDAAGIGLFRSEFLYLEKKEYPTEEELFTVYKEVAQRMGGKRVVIRTLDIGADKLVDYFELEKEENPAMGYRAIRICLDREYLFKTQLRAIYRASAYGNIAVMFPMIISLDEVLRIKKICEEVKAELKKKQITFVNVEFGILIETPAAVMISDLLAKEVDFISIGTNDLTQYALAIDRQNTKLGKLYDTHHPAILRMIRMVTENGHREGCRVGICGELAADTKLTEHFLKLGIDELSVSPNMILMLRKTIRNIN